MPETRHPALEWSPRRLKSTIGFPAGGRDEAPGTSRRPRSMSPLTTALRATSALVLSLAAVGARAETRACTDLLSVDLTDVGGTGSRVTSATRAEDRGVAVCAIEGTLAPAIGFKVQLPLRTWAGRYLQAGCGGLCGQASLRVGAADGCAPLAAGRLRHRLDRHGPPGHGRRVRARTRRSARTSLTAACTSPPSPRRSSSAPSTAATRSARYFTGCSDGGREALDRGAALPRPTSTASSPARRRMNFQVQNSLYHAWQARSNTGPDGKAILAAPRLPLLHRGGGRPVRRPRRPGRRADRRPARLPLRSQRRLACPSRGHGHDQLPHRWPRSRPCAACTTDRATRPPASA